MKPAERKVSAGERARGWVAFVWMGGALTNAVVLVSLWLAGRIHDDPARTAGNQLNKLYGPYVGAVIGYYFAQKNSNTGPTSGLGSFIALGISIAWNGAIAVALLGPWLGIFGIEGANKFLEEFMPSLGWLAGPAIGFHFGMKSKSKE